MIRDNIFIELRGYLSIIKRRRLFVVIPAVMALALGVLQFRLPKATYRAGVQFIIGQPASVESATDSEQRFYDWLTSEYVVNSVTDWVNGSEFSELVRLTLIEQGAVDEDEYEVEDMANAILASTIRSRLTVLVDADTEEEVEIIMSTVLSVLEQFENGTITPLPQLDIPSGIEQLDVVSIEPIPPNVTAFIYWPLRMVVAAIAGLLFALMIEYLDPRVYEKRQLEAIYIPVLGLIPRPNSEL